jgi:hypothetical protein
VSTDNAAPDSVETLPEELVQCWYLNAALCMMGKTVSSSYFGRISCRWQLARSEPPASRKDRNGLRSLASRFGAGVRLGNRYQRGAPGSVLKKARRRVIKAQQQFSAVD